MNMTVTAVVVVVVVFVVIIFMTMAVMVKGHRLFKCTFHHCVDSVNLLGIILSSTISVTVRNCILD